MNEEAGITYLPGFAWALPEAFAPAVCGYRFEQGDVLQRDPSGYAALAGRVAPGLTAMQLRQPPRSARATPSEFDGDRRLANWQSEVELELVDLAAGTVELRSTTQGRLFTTLWKGDESALHGEGEDPPLPRSARELAQLLRDGTLALPRPTGTLRGCRFCFVVDLSSDASRMKATTIQAALGTLGRVVLGDRDPAAAGAPVADTFHPTLVVRELVLEQVELHAAEAALKCALYVGSGASERFSVTRHGLLEALDPIGGARPVDA